MAVAQLVIKAPQQPDVTTYSVEDIESLQQQSDRLSHLLEVMPAGVVVIDGQGNVRQANQVAIDLLGEPLEGQSWRMIIRRSFRPQADDGHEVSLYDGRKVKLSICPLEKEPGQLIVLTDLTETRQLQQRVSHMQRLSSLGNMVASLAHQIRTPLSAAMLYAANIASSRLDQDSRQKFSDKLLSRLQDLEHQVNDMLLFAKSGSEQVVSELSMQSLLEEVETGCDAMLSQHQARIKVEMPDPDIIILGNRTALAGALQNLIHNSLQIKPQGAEITLSAKRAEDVAGQVLLSVSDNGPGFDEQHINQLFEPFYTTRSQGTGLGLAVVKAVAQSHKGSVYAQSPRSGGASFTLSLPIFIPTHSHCSKQELTA
ncbi:sensor histidine kinase [Neptunicella sp. SCSIO 80796]|uniref:sensor histidine kinase n=1 Tax=Neptunicella plasticusilytica TaxID=3117012 RepID=UPI003A4D7551